jgi:DNA primase
MVFIDFAALKAKISIEQVLTMLQLNLKKQGERLRGPCPVCKSAGDRALVVTPDKGVFYCFGPCKSGGDMIELVARVRGHEAEDRLARAGLDIASHFGINNSSPKRAQEQERSAGPLRPLDYLDPEHASLRELGLSKETCEHFGAGYAPKGIMRGRLAIPIHDAEGKLLAYCGRAVKGEEPTLIFPKGFEPESVIFNAHRVHEETLYAARDPLAVLTAFENGVDNVIAFMGDITPAQLERLRLLMTEKGAQPLELF